MIRITSTMIKCTCRCYCSRNRGRLASHYHWRNWLKIKKKYINFCDHRNSAIDIVADSSSPVTSEIERKPISMRGYRRCLNRFLLSVQCRNEINWWVLLLEIRSHAHLDYRKRGCVKTRTILNHTWLWAKIIIFRGTGEKWGPILYLI